MKHLWCGAFLLVVLLPLSAHAQAAGKAGRVRVALVSSGSGDSINALLDLAQAKVSMQPGVELLDRQAMARILQEQKLSLAGLVDANTAVTAGKLLNVDLFVFVEADPQSKDVLGVIIFDAANGVKFHDAALPMGKLDEQIDAVSQAVGRAAGQVAAGLQDLRTVCLLSVRNADLPRSHDSLGQTIAFLLERQLLGSSKIALLERKRLDFVTKEKALTTEPRHKALLASLVMIDVEISRAGKGVRATAFLTDNQGKQLGKAEAEEAMPHAANLAEKLQAAVRKQLQADPPAKAANLSRESKRFQEEGKRLYSHQDWLAAVQATEAAFALDPTQSLLQSQLARYLGDQAIQRTQEGPFRGTMAYRKVPNDKLKLAMQSCIRSVELRRDALQKLPDKTFATLQTHVLQYKGVFRDTPDVHFMRCLYHPFNRDSFDDEAKDLRLQLVSLYRASVLEELEHLGNTVRQDRSPKSTLAFQAFTKGIHSAMAEMPIAGLAKADVELLLLPIYRLWLEVSSLPKIQLDSETVTRFCQEALPSHPEYVDFYEGLAKHPHPLLSLHARWQVLHIQVSSQKRTPAQAESVYQELRRSAFQAALGANPTLRVNLYKFLFNALEQWPSANAEQKNQERFALADVMLERRDLDFVLIMRLVQNDVKAKNYRQGWQVSERALALLNTGKSELSGNPDLLRTALMFEQKKILAARPDFAEKTVVAPAPWSQAEHLLNLKDQPKFRALGTPLVEGDDVYVVALEEGFNELSLRLLRISLKGKGVQSLSQATMRPIPRGSTGSWLSEITGCCLGKEHVYVGTRKDGLFALDRNGKPGVRLSKDFPNQEIEALAWHDGTLFVSCRDGYLLAMDSLGGNLVTLASSRRRERLSPFDDDEAFRVPFMTVDAERQRLIFLLYQRPNQLIQYPASTVFPKETTNGLWEYDLKTKAFKRRLELYHQTLLWGSQIRAGRLLLAKPGSNPTGIVDFDLVKNQGKLLWARNHIGPEMLKEKALSQEEYYPLHTVLYVQGDYLWNVHPFSRASLTKRYRETYPKLGEMPDFHWIVALNGNYSGMALEALGTNQFLLGNPSGLWRLTMKKE